MRLWEQQSTVDDSLEDYEFTAGRIYGDALDILIRDYIVQLALTDHADAQRLSAKTLITDFNSMVKSAWKTYRKAKPKV